MRSLIFQYYYITWLLILFGSSGLTREESSIKSDDRRTSYWIRWRVFFHPFVQSYIASRWLHHETDQPEGFHGRSDDHFWYLNLRLKIKIRLQHFINIKIVSVTINNTSWCAFSDTILTLHICCWHRGVEFLL